MLLAITMSPSCASLRLTMVALLNGVSLNLSCMLTMPVPGVNVVVPAALMVLGIWLLGTWPEPFNTQTPSAKPASAMIEFSEVTAFNKPSLARLGSSVSESK